MSRESPIFTHLYDMLRWLLPLVGTLPRAHRSGLARQLPDAAFRLQTALLRAAKQPERTALYLREADAALAELRLLLRLTKDLAAIPFNQYEMAVRLLDPIGRLLGGWQRTVESRLLRASPVEQGPVEPS